jgi:hypothetical protein
MILDQVTPIDPHVSGRYFCDIIHCTCWIFWNNDKFVGHGFIGVHWHQNVKTSMMVKSKIFWDLIPCSLVENKKGFEGFTASIFRIEE